MKAVLAIFACFLGMIAASCVYSENDGRPVCNSENLRLSSKFRNNWDPTAYWNCAADNNEAAVAMRCDGKGWSQSKQACVDWEEWEWTPPCDPPTMFIA